MLSNFMKSSKSKSKPRVAITNMQLSGPYSASILDQNNIEHQNNYIASTMPSTSNNFDNKNDFENTYYSNSLSRTSQNHTYNIKNTEDNNYNNFDNKAQFTMKNDNFETNYSSCNFNQPASITQSNSLISSKSSGSTIKNRGSSDSNYNLRSSTYNSGRTIKYSEVNQNNGSSSPIINGTHTLSKNVMITSHPLPSSNFNNIKGSQPLTPLKTAGSNVHNTYKGSKRTSKSSFETSPSNGYLSPTLSDTKSNASSYLPSRQDDSVMSMNTLELYDLYSSAAAYVNATNSPLLNSPRFMDNFRSLSRNFKMKEYSTNPSLSATSRGNRISDDSNSRQDDSDLMSTVLNVGVEDESDDSDNEPLYYYRNKNKKISTPSISSNSTSNFTTVSNNSNNQNNLYGNGYYGSNSSLSSNLSNVSNKNSGMMSKNTTTVNNTKSTTTSANNTNPAVNRRISRSQPNLALPATSNASKAYTTMLRSYKYSGNNTNSLNSTGNFTNVQELQPITGTPKSSTLPRKEVSSNSQRPCFTPPLSYTQTNTQSVNDNSVLPQQQLQVPIIIGKRKQSLGCSAIFKDYKPSTPKSSIVSSYNNSSNAHSNIININDKDISSSSSDLKNNSKNEYSTTATTTTTSYETNSISTSIPIPESKQSLQQQTKPLSPQLKLLRHASNSPVLKNKNLSASPQLTASLEKPLPPSPMLGYQKSQKRTSTSSLSSLNNQKPLPSPLLTQIHQPLASPQLASQSPLQSYVTLNGSSSSSESSNLKYPISNLSDSLDNDKSSTSQATLKQQSTSTSTSTFANAAILNDKIISPHPISTSNITNNIFSNMKNQNQAPSPIVNYTSNVGNKSPLLGTPARINSPKLLNNPFVKKDQELQQQQSFFTHMNHSSPNLSTTPTISTTNLKVTSSPKMTSPIRINSPRINSPISSSPRVGSPRIPYSKNPILTNEVLSKNSYPNMPLSSFNYKSLARTPPITYAATITNSPTLSTQSTPKASSTVVVNSSSSETNYDQQQCDISNTCTINKRVSSFNIEHQFQEQLQEQIQNGNSSIKSSKYDDYYTLPSEKSPTLSPGAGMNNNNSNTSSNSLSVPISSSVSPKLQQSIPSSLTPLTPINPVPTSPTTEGALKNKNYGSLDRSKHIRHKRNVSFNDEKNKIIESNDINSSSISNDNSGNISGNLSVGTENTSITSSTEDEKMVNSFSSYPENVANLTLKNTNEQNNYISQAKSVHVSSKHKNLSSIIKEKEQTVKKNSIGHKHAISDSLENLNVYYQHHENNNTDQEIIHYEEDENNEIEYPHNDNNNKDNNKYNNNSNNNDNNININNIKDNENNNNKVIYNYNHNHNHLQPQIPSQPQRQSHTKNSGNKNDKYSSNKEHSEDIERKQFYVKTYRKLNNKELSYLQEVAYKQLKQSFPESSGFIKKDVLKVLQQKAKNKGSSPKWWSYWKKESKTSCSVFKTPLNTSILYASVSLDSVDEENPRRIPIIIYKCVQYLKKYGLKKEGIFRVNGSERRIQNTVKSFDEPPYLGPDSFENLNVYDVAGLIKLYIRQLPDSLFPNEIYLPLLKYFDKYGSEKDRIKILQLFLMMIPRNYLILLEYLLDLFSLITKYSEYNQMTSGNLARIFAPNLLKPIPPNEPSLKDYEITSTIIDFMINHDLDFRISRSDNMLLKILQEIPDLTNKNHKTKKSNLRIPFMSINNIFSDSEETDDERSSKYNNSGEFNISKYSPQLSIDSNNSNSNSNSNSNISNTSNSSSTNNSRGNLVNNNLNLKLNIKNIKTGFNGSLPLTPPQSPSSPNKSTSTFSSIKSQLNALTSANEPKINNDINNNHEHSNEDNRSFNNLTIKREATSFSVIRPNQNQMSATSPVDSVASHSIPYNSNLNNNSNSNSNSNSNNNVNNNISSSITPMNKVTIVNAYDLNPNLNVNQPQIPIDMNNTTLLTNNIGNSNPLINNNIVKNGSIHSVHSVQHSNSKTIIRKNTVEENDNSSRSPSNDLSVERNNSAYSINKLRQTASEI